MTIRVVPLIIAAALLTTSCASTPTGPSVMALPGSGRTFEQFQADDARCRQVAANDTAATKQGNVHAQQRYDMTYMQCMYAAGDQIPMAGRPPGAGAPASSYPDVPQPPAGTPPAPPPSTSK